MNEQDEKILQLYLKDVKRKKIFIIFAIIFLIVSILFYGVYAKYKQSSNDIDNSIQEETKNNIINEHITNEETTTNATVEENIENKVDETPKENTVAKEENSNQEAKEKPKENTQTTTSNENKDKSTNEKPANKDFLFTDGYTMENVTQAAQDYLKSYDFSGECIPIKDNEGVYLGMRVIFY